MGVESTKAHLDVLIDKHRCLDKSIEEIYVNTYNTDKLRKLKTQKLWLKDEIYRLKRQLGISDE